MIGELRAAATASCSPPAAARARREENRQLLAASGTVVYLHAQPDDLYERVRHDRNRPLLATADPLARLRELLRGARSALPVESPTWSIDTGSAGRRGAGAATFLASWSERWKASA